MSDDGDFADVYTLTRRESGQTTFCRQLLEQSINDTYKPEYLAQWPLLKAEYRAWLRLLFSEEKWRAAASEEAKSETIAYWEDLIVDTLDVGIEMIYVRVAKRLAEAYVEQLRQHQPGTPEARLLTKRITDLATRDTSQQDAWTSSEYSTDSHPQRKCRLQVWLQDTIKQAIQSPRSNSVSMQ